MKLIVVRASLLGLVLVISSPLTQADSVISCEKAKAWADSQPTLPSTLQDISTLNIAYRREVIRRSSGAQRAALWKEHLNTFRSSLTADQTKALQAILNVITPEAMARGGVIVGLPSPTELAKIFNTADDPDLAQKMFSVLGPWDNDVLAKNTLAPKKAHSPSRKIASKSGPGSPVPVEPGGPSLGDCNCNGDSDWCSNSTCIAPADCGTSPSGCGTLWTWSCNGSCRAGD